MERYFPGWANRGSVQSRFYRRRSRKTSDCSRRAFNCWLTALPTGAALAPLAAHAQGADWLSRSVKIPVGLTPGGVPDIAARALSQWLAKSWKQPVVVETAWARAAMWLHGPRPLRLPAATRCCRCRLRTPWRLPFTPGYPLTPFVTSRPSRSPRRAPHWWWWRPICR